MNPNDPVDALIGMCIVFAFAGGLFALGGWLADRGLERRAPDFVDDQHIRDYRHLFAEWVKACEWLKENRMVAMRRPPAIPPVIAIDWKRRAA